MFKFSGMVTPHDNFIEVSGRKVVFGDRIKWRADVVEGKLRQEGDQWFCLVPLPPNVYADVVAHHDVLTERVRVKLC